MFSILSPEQYSAVESLFKPISHNLVIATIIEGHPAGIVWANDEKTPSIALIWDRLDEFLFLGGEPIDDVVQELRSILVNTIIPDSAKIGGTSLTLQCSSESWAEYIPFLLERTQIQERQKLLYVFDSQNTLNTNNWKDRVPEGFNVKQIDKELFDSALENVDDLVAFTDAIWGDVDTFIRDGVGFCVVNDEKLMSRCVTDFVRGKEYELYVETDSDYRGKGLATLVTNVLTEYLVERGSTMIWQCWGDNLGSIKVAERVGFRKEKVSPVYLFDYTKQNGE